jgi:transposase
MKNMDGRKLKHDVLTELRKAAVAMVQNGESPEIVVQALGFSRACTYNWLAMYVQGRRLGCPGCQEARRPPSQAVRTHDQMGLSNRGR